MEVGVAGGAGAAAAGLGDGVAAAGGVVVCVERSQLASKARDAILEKAKPRNLMSIISSSDLRPSEASKITRCPISIAQAASREGRFPITFRVAS